jgi:hypothetical protein
MSWQVLHECPSLISTSPQAIEDAFQALIHFREWWLAIFGKGNQASRTSHSPNIDEDFGDCSIETRNEATIGEKRSWATEHGCPILDQINHQGFAMTDPLATH